MKKYLSTRIKAILTGMTMAAAMMASGCGGSSGSELGGSQSGELAIGLTDTQGDFVSYTVTVSALELTRANGAVVDALPLATEVDFAQLTELTEFITAASVPVGAYVAATMTLDFSDANIQVEDADGNAVAATQVVDSDGNALTTLEVTVNLEGANRLVIAAGVPASLTLDFDLAASNTVTFADNGEATVTVEPFLIAELEPQAPKVHRVRGALQSVDTASDEFTVIVRPFVTAVSGADDAFGTLTVVTNDSTVFDINGDTTQGAAGLAQLAALAQFTAVVAVGDLEFNPRRFVASEVYAGSSVPGGTLDTVTGNVTARSGDVLTVSGATLLRTNGSVLFNDAVTVQLDSGTQVRKQTEIDAYTIDDISVGQRVTIFGTLTNSDPDNLALTASHARLLLTTLRGMVVTASPLVMNLQSIDGRSTALFDFAGTGTSPAQDALATNYEVAVGSLDLANVAVGETEKVRGFVAPFGTAPEDFTAQSVTDLSDARAALNIVWTPATTTPTSAVTATTITLDLTGSPLLHHVNRAGALTNLAALGAAPTLVSASDAGNVFSIKYRGVVQIYTDFETFAAGLDERIADGQRAKNLHARGDLNEDTATFTARVVSVRMQ